MKQIIAWGSCLVFLVTGCASTNKKLDPTDYPVHTYQQPFDLVFKKALDVLSQQEGWIIEPTRKGDGIIELSGTKYTNYWMDMDIQKARFIVKNVGRTQTSVELDVDHSVCKDKNCLKLLEKVDEVVSALPPPKEPSKPQA